MRVSRVLLLFCCGVFVAGCLLASAQEQSATSPQILVAVPTNSSTADTQQEGVDDHADHDHDHEHASPEKEQGVAGTTEDHEDHDHADDEHEHDEDHDHADHDHEGESGTVDGTASGEAADHDHDHEEDHDHADHDHDHEGEKSGTVDSTASGEAEDHDHDHEEDHDHANHDDDHEGESGTVDGTVSGEAADHDHDHDHEEDHDHVGESENVDGTVSGEAADHDHDHEEDHDHADHDHEGESGTVDGTVSGEAADHDHDHEEDDPHAGHLHGGGSCTFEAPENYNMGLRIGSVFILLGVSALGAFLPVLLHMYTRKYSLLLIVIRMGTFFGFGTILATGFIHTLIPAAEKLSSDCLSEAWLDSYEGWAYLFVVISVLMMQLIDYCVEMAYIHYSNSGAIQEGDLHGAITHIHDHRHDGPGGEHAAHVKHLESVTSSGSEEGAPQDEEGGNCPVHGDSCHTLLTQKRDVSAIVGIYLMEGGIVLHSVLIGLALGVTSSTAFNTLLIAISFHQFFEGFAIGSAAIDSGMGRMKAAVLAAIYSVTTPIGIAVGIGVHTSYHSGSRTALMVEGILDAFATGILIYVVLIELINPMMTQSKWLRSQRWWLQMLAFASLYAGAAVMAVLGKWV